MMDPGMDMAVRRKENGRYSGIADWRHITIFLTAAFLVMSGCGGQTGPATESSAPAGGGESVTRLDLQRPAQSEWRDVLVPETAGGGVQLERFGLMEDHGPGGYLPEGPHSHFTYVLSGKAFDADQVLGFRLDLPNTAHAGFRWASEDQVRQDQYPFAPENFLPFKNVGPGQFELDLSDTSQTPQWKGRIRYLRVDAYGKPGYRVEVQRFQVNLRGEFVAVEPLQASLTPTRPDLADSLVRRAVLTGEPVEAGPLGELPPWFSTSAGRLELSVIGRQRGIRQLDAGNVEEARAIFTAEAHKSGIFVDFLYGLRDALTPAQQDLLWPDQRPFLTLQDFSSPESPGFQPWLEEQYREVLANEVREDALSPGSRSAYLDLGAGRVSGTSMYGVPVQIAIADRPFTIRVALRQTPLSDLQIGLGFWFPSVNQGLHTTHEITGTSVDGRKVFELTRDFYRERNDYARRQGHDLSGAVINKIGIVLSDQTEMQCWMESIEIGLPGMTEATP